MTPTEAAAVVAATALSGRLKEPTTTTSQMMISKLPAVASAAAAVAVLEEKEDGEQHSHNERPHHCKERGQWWRRTRIHVALLGLAIAAVNCYAQATFCIAIVEMVLPADYVPSPPSASETKVNIQQHQAPLLSTMTTHNDHSCPIEFKYRDYYDDWRFSTTTTIRNISDSEQTRAQQTSTTTSGGGQPTTVDVSNRFEWDAGSQGLLLGAFALGTAPFQIVGGRLAELHGAKWVLLMGCIGTGLTNLAIPYLAHFSFPLLLLNRVLMGVAQAGMEPGLMCLLADWLTPAEAGFFISMLLFAICLGFFLGSLCSSFILGLAYGWPLTYYISGGLNLAVALIWYIYADSWPRASKYISEEELRFIEREQAAGKNNHQQDLTTKHENGISSGGGGMSADRGDWSGAEKKKLSQMPLEGAAAALSSAQNQQQNHQHHQPDPLGAAPWRTILGSRPVWAFILCKISIRWCADVLSNELPTYLANVLHLSIKINGLLNSLSTALFAISSFLTGWLATSKLCLGGSGGGASHSSKTRLRKSFQSVASFGSALCLILMTHYDCDLLVSTSMLLVLSCCLVMGTGGELQIPYDMTSRYPGTLHGLACTLSVSGWLAPPLIGLILGDQPSSRARWSLVWYSTAAINLLGGLVFVLFADAGPRDFDAPPARSDRKRHCRQQPLSPSEGGPTRRERESYVNDGLNASSCESSPKTPHHNNHNNQNQQPPTTKALNPLDATKLLLHFDTGQLIKCRQFESSFIQPRAFQINCSANRYFDSHQLQQHQADVIHPYRDEREREREQQPESIDCLPGCKATTTSSKQPRPSWSRLFAAASSKKRHPPAPISNGRRRRRISEESLSLANEKFMPNERVVAAAAAMANADLEAMEALVSEKTINHSGRSHGGGGGCGGNSSSGGSAAASQLADKLTHRAAARALHPHHNPAAADTRHQQQPPVAAAALHHDDDVSHSECGPNLIENAAAAADATSLATGSPCQDMNDHRKGPPLGAATEPSANYAGGDRTNDNELPPQPPRESLNSLLALTARQNTITHL